MKKKFKNSALLVVDIVNSCCREEYEIKEWNITFKKIRKMVPKLKRFIEKYKALGGEVVYTNCVCWDKKHLPKNINEVYKDPTLCYYTKDKSGLGREFYLLKPVGDKVFTKNTYDAFTNPKLDSYLKKKKITDLFISGVFTEGCVQATISGAFSKGYNIIVLKDLVETRDDKESQLVQKLLLKRFWAGLYGYPKKSSQILK